MNGELTDSIKSQVFYKNFDEVFPFIQEKIKHLQLMRFNNKLNVLSGNSLKRWLFKNFETIGKSNKWLTESNQFFIIREEQIELYNILYEQYNSIRERYKLPLISSENYKIHIARFYGEDFSKFKQVVRSGKLDSKQIMFDDSIYMKYYETVYKVLSQCNQKPSIKYVDFYRKFTSIDLNKEKDKYNNISRKSYTVTKSVIKNELTTGFVYGILDPRHPEWIKIGCTSNLDERLLQYNTYTPFGNIEYITYKYVKNKFVSEKILHNIFKNNRGNGEWFHITKDDFISAIKVI